MAQEEVETSFYCYMICGECGKETITKDRKLADEFSAKELGWEYDKPNDMFFCPDHKSEETALRQYIYVDLVTGTWGPLENIRVIEDFGSTTAELFDAMSESELIEFARANGTKATEPEDH